MMMTNRQVWLSNMVNEKIDSINEKEKKKKDSTDEKIWKKTLYNKDYEISELTLATAGFTVQYSPEYFIEKFINDFSKRSINKSIKEKIEPEIKSLNLTGAVNKNIFSIFDLYHDVEEANKRSFSINSWVYNNNDNDGNIVAVNIAVKERILNSVSEIIKNNSNLSNDFINYLIVSNPKLTEVILDIDNIKLNYETLLYITLTQPKLIKKLDEKKLLDEKMANAILTLNPITIYHFSKEMNVWNKFKNKKEYEARISDAVLELIDFYSKYKKKRAFYSAYKDDEYKGFSTKLDLGCSSWETDNTIAILKFFLNQKYNQKYLSKLKKIIPEKIVIIEDPSKQDMNIFIKYFLSSYNKDSEFVDKDLMGTFAKFIDDHQNIVNENIYNEFVSTFYGDMLIEEIKPFR